MGIFTWIKEGIYNNLLLEDRYLLLIDGLETTLVIAVASILLGTFLGACLCGLRMSKNAVLRTLAKCIITLFRGIPQVVLLMIMFYVVFAKASLGGEVVSIITFALIFAAYTCEIFRSAIEVVPKGQREAGIALGFTKTRTFTTIILPQAIRNAFPVYKGEFIALIKLTSIVGYIAVQDLTKASDIIRSRTFDAFFPLILISVIYFVLAWFLAKLLEWSMHRFIAERA